MSKPTERQERSIERVLALLALLVLAGILATAVWSLLDARRSARTRAAREVQNLASAFEQDTRRIIQIYDLALRQAIDAFGQPGVNEAPLPLRTRLFFSHIDVAPNLGGMYLVDASGHVTLSSQMRATIGMDLNDREYFKVHQQTTNVSLYISPPLLNRTYYAQALHFSRRLNNKDGSFAGVVAGSVKTELFRAQFANVDLGSKTSSVALLWGGSQLVVGVPSDRYEVGADLRETAALKMLQGDHGVVQSIGVLHPGVPSMVAYREIAGTPLTVIVSRSLEDIDGPWQRKMFELGSALLFLAALVVGLGTLSLRELRRRRHAESTAWRAEAEARSLAHQAQAASRAKSQFLAVMSHELRTPLNHVIGFSEIIAREDLGPTGNPSYTQFARDIHESGTHLLSLVDDILDQVLTDTGRLALTEQPCDLRECVRQAVQTTLPRAERLSICVTLDLPPHMPDLYLDASRIRQAVFNILSNAVKFSRSGGTVTVAVSWDELHGARIAIGDDGAGLSPQDQARVLQPFTQIRDVMTSGQDGLGLGLPIAKALFELHGGTLKLFSRVGNGTAVELTLPASRARPAATEATAA